MLPCALAATLFCGLAACTHQETVSIAISSAPHPPATPSPGDDSRAPQSARAKLRQFDYRSSDLISVRRTVVNSGKSCTTEDIIMVIDDPLRRIGRYQQHFIYYRPGIPGPLPTVLVFPLFGDAMWVDKLAAARFCRLGFNAMIVTPAESPADTTRPLDKVNEMLIRYTIVTRMGIDMLEGFPETDPDRIYAYGMSMGGIRSTLAFGVEPRIRKAGVITAGGDLPGIIADTQYGTLSDTRDARMAAEQIPDLASFRSYMESTMTIDPLDFACLRAPEDIFFVASSRDRLLPDEYQKKLYDAFSRPRERRFPSLMRSPTGHLTTGARFYWYADRMADFFRSP